MCHFKSLSWTYYLHIMEVNSGIITIFLHLFPRTSFLRASLEMEQRMFSDEGALVP